MNKLLELTITAGLAATASGAFAGELPSFERSGFPITTHQVSVLGIIRCSRALNHPNAHAKWHASLSASDRGLDPAPAN